MKFHIATPAKVSLFSLVLILQFSCSKDSDLLAEQISIDPEVAIGTFVRNDSFQILTNNNAAESNNSAEESNEAEETIEVTVSDESGTILNDSYEVTSNDGIELDVLANDTFDRPETAAIVLTSQPDNGEVEINPDNTLKFIPSTFESTVETFTYTVQFENDEGAITTETGAVTVSINVQDGVNVSTYGAVGDGITDDTAALQAAFDSGTDLISDPGKTYLVSSTLFLDTNSTQTINFNGSKITRNKHVDYLLRIDKRNHAETNTSIRNLDVDGNSLSGSLVYIASKVQFTNVDIHHAKDNSLSREPRGIWIHITDKPGVGDQWVFDNVNIYWIWNSISPGVNQTDSKAQGFYLYWPEKKTGGLQIVYKNSSVHDVYGDEGDGMIINTPGNDISFTDNSFWGENLTFYNCQRRAVKGYAGNLTFVNSDFYTADYDNPYINNNWISAGLFAIGAYSSNPSAQNNLVCGCNFHGGYTKPNDGWDSRVILGGINGPTGVEFRRCTFSGDQPRNTALNSGDRIYAGLKIGHDTGAIKICDCEFTGASTTVRGNKIVQGYPGALSGGKYQIDSNNSYAVGQTAALARISGKVDVVDLSNDCDVCPSIDD